MTESAVEILLVEDNPDDVQLTLHALRKYNLTNRIHVVRDGAEALDFIFCKGPYADRDILDRPKLILLDLKLPLVDGIEVLQHVKASPQTRMIPVAVLTSSREDPDIERCYALGANSYIVKPVEFSQFAEAVRLVGMYWMLLNQPPKL